MEGCGDEYDGVWCGPGSPPPPGRQERRAGDLAWGRPGARGVGSQTAALGHGGRGQQSSLKPGLSDQTRLSIRKPLRKPWELPGTEAGAQRPETRHARANPSAQTPGACPPRSRSVSLREEHGSRPGRWGRCAVTPGRLTYLGVTL